VPLITVGVKDCWKLIIFNCCSRATSSRQRGPLGIGVATKAKRLKDGLKLLKEATVEDWKKFVDELGLLANGGGCWYLHNKN